MQKLSDFFSAYNKTFKIVISYDHQSPPFNETGDTVRMIAKDSLTTADADAQIDVTAVSLSVNADGDLEALFELSHVDTDINPDDYYVRFDWEPAGGGKFVVNGPYALAVKDV